MRPTTCDRGGVSVVAKLCVRQGTVLCCRKILPPHASYFMAEVVPRSSMEF